MNLIIFSRNGIIQPYLVEKDSTALATYKLLVESALPREDLEEIKFWDCDDITFQVDELLSGSNVSIEWWDKLEVNKF
jgi:hypothetical protein